MRNLFLFITISIIGISCNSKKERTKSNLIVSIKISTDYSGMYKYYDLIVDSNNSISIADYYYEKPTKYFSIKSDSLSNLLKSLIENFNSNVDSVIFTQSVEIKRVYFYNGEVDKNVITKKKIDDPSINELIKIIQNIIYQSIQVDSIYNINDYHVFDKEYLKEPTPPR
jgi:hypothetical protein